MSKRTPPDLSHIKPPATPPLDQPDPKTTEEAQELKKRAIAQSPTERAEDANRRHLRSLAEAISYLTQEKSALQGQLGQLHIEMAAHRVETTTFSVRCAKLETAARPIGVMNLLANFMVAAGSACLGVAGVFPNLDDQVKICAASAGGGIVLCGVVLMIAAYKSSEIR